MAKVISEANPLSQLECAREKLNGSYILIERLNPKNDNHVDYVQVNLLTYTTKVFADYYPNFASWYQCKIVEGFLTGKRIVYVVRNSTTIYGVSLLRIADKNNSSNKICSFYIAPEIRGGGVGHILMQKSLEEFDLSKKSVVITVPEERILEDMNSKGFLYFLQLYGFNLVSEISDKYRSGRKEFILVKDVNPKIFKA